MCAMVQLAWPAGAFAAALLAGLVVRALALAALGRWLRRPDGLASLLDSIRLPSLLWCIVLGLYAAMQVAPLPRQVSHLLGLVLQAAVIASVTLTAASILGTLIRRAGERQALGVAVSGLGQAVMRAIVLVVGAVILLSSLGIEIAPILTALGVGGLAVALALQDTLSNLFAGVHLLADRPLRVGDYAKIADVEGFVIDIGWRSTRLRTLQNNVVVVPNRTVAQSVITNYALPEPRMALLLRVGVSYRSDLERVEAVLLEEAIKGVGSIPGLLAEPPPIVRFNPGFGNYSLDLTLVCHVATFVDQYTVQHELRKRILQRFRADGIEIPFPVQTVELRTPDGELAPSRQPAGLAHQGEQRQGGQHRQG
jgi:small-conductance mechanosensitive channel